ncbi:NAD(P)H-dependent flavin oxidoreductase [Extibacter muris]|uniref:NAD(P)H-dependent flavin oxidoreductase n=1 Tax=Extibacter muris TaxID=1796622 RepID=UPI001D090AA1|nr:nitronate monooxygenase family protein [Extibacter muris]MCB6202650.1 nitronate monooxygenase family protein [Extibacter muris]MCQ4663887.1 nitronate monooxygenase family protein [Extibacter muris]MCQ4693453.1 nitronate monooxygenase family protein [Extibacter muris]
MKTAPLVMGNIRAEVPVIQGGMGVGISLGGLAGAVAREGGIGIISAAQIGFKEPDFDRNALEANLRAIPNEYDKAREAAPHGVIGFNIMVAMRHYEAYVRAAIEAGADLIISGAGLPTELPKIAGDSEVKLAPIVSTDKSAQVILKYWDRKYKRVPDLLVIEGPKAGGHLGFTREQLELFGGDSYDAEILRIMDTVKGYEDKYDQKIPVALAGGIETSDQAAHAFSLGADAIQVASRFVTTEECDADIRYKEVYLGAGKEDIVIVKSPVGMPGRAIRNAFMERVASGERIPHSPCHGCLHKCSPDEIPYCITDALIHAARGEVEDALLFCGANAYKADRIETVKEVIDSLLPERV